MPTVQGLQTKGGKIMARSSGNEIIEALKAMPGAHTGAVAKGRTARETAIVEVRGSLAGGAKYHGRVWPLNSSLFTTSGTLAATELAENPGVDNCYVANLGELGQSTHDLATGDYFLGVLVGFATDFTP